jgi:hypothetical protein
MHVNCRFLREKVTDLKKDLNDPKTDHTATASQLKKATKKVLILSTKLDEAAEVKKELGLLADQMNDRMDETSNELELSKAKVALISRWIIVSPQKYETTNHSYQERTSHISKYLKQLKVELVCHRGTKTQLTRAVLELIVARAEAVDSEMEVEEAQKQLIEKNHISLEQTTT